MAAFAVAPFAHAAPGSGASSAPAAPSRAAAVHGAAKPKPAGTSTKVTAKSLAPNFGFQKYRVGVQVKSGAYVPPGTTTAGTKLTITETGPAVPNGTATSTCTTDASTATAGSTATFCLAAPPPLAVRKLQQRYRPDLTTRPTPDGAPSDEQFLAFPGDTVTVTQTTVEPNLLLDPATASIAPCTAPEGPPVCVDPATGALLSTDEIFDDPGLPPVAVNDSAHTTFGQGVTVDVLPNDTTHGAPVTVTVTVAAAPAHGTAIVHAAANTATIHYQPKAGFFGVDHFRYTLTTANGSSTATVTVTVTAPPPVAKDDSATTAAGTAVTIAALANDDARGVTGLKISSVADPAHGTARIDGGSVVYTPDSGFAGTERFTYVAATLAGSDTAMITVTVQAQAQPQAQPQQPLAATGADDTRLVGLGVLLLLGGTATTVAGRRRRGRDLPIS